MTRSIDTRPRRRPARRRGRVIAGLLFASPFIVGALLLYAYPIFASGYYSLTSFNLFQAPTWVGFDNYAHMLGDRRFWIAFSNTLLFTAIGVPLTIGIAVIGAHVLNLRVRGQAIFRALAYLPVVIPVVVGSYLWRWLFNSKYGYVDEILGWFGIPGPSWLTRPEFGGAAVLIVCMWTIGAAVLVYLAALKDIPAEYYEAASLDGAGVWRRFRYITWPSLGPITVFQVLTVAISYFQLFTQPYLLTQDASANNITGNSGGGGPGDAMLTISTYIYLNAFRNLQMGYASAIAWVLFALIAILAAITALISRKVVHVDD